MGRLTGHAVRTVRTIRAFLTWRRLRSYNPQKFGGWWRAAANSIWQGSRNPAIRPNYLCGATIGALQAKKLGIGRIYLIEFGVATGGGFRSLIAIGHLIRSNFDIDVEVIGFDNRDGLPQNEGYRDHPEIWKPKQFAMAGNFDDLDGFARANGARLIIGDVKETLPRFLEELHAEQREGGSAVAFCSIDVDFYSSTTPITEFLEQLDARYLLPATVVYVDDVFVNWTYSAHSGELLAIREFNHRNDRRKIELKHEGLRLFALHAFDHKARNLPATTHEPFEIYYKDLCNAVHYKA